MSDPITLLYTHNLGGDLDLLPRLATHIKELRTAVASHRVLRVDFGASCSPDVWHCEVTRGRSLVIGLDALGFDVIYTHDVLEAAAYDQVREQIQAALVDTHHPHTVDGITFAAEVAPVNADGLLILPARPLGPVLEGRSFIPAALLRGQVGRVDIDPLTGLPDLASFTVHDLPPDTPPDPTLAGIVTFIVDEARYTQKKKKTD